MNKKYILNGLDCAQCAAKLENNINKLDEVKSASVNFPLKLLTVKYNANNENAEAVCLNLIKRLEPEINVQNQHVENKGSAFDVLPLLGLALFLLSYMPSLPFLKYLLIFTGYFLISYKILLKAFRRIVNLEMMDENVLMSIATIGALALGEYFEAIAVMLFYLVGEYLQQLAVNKSRKSLSSLMDIKPVTARLVSGEVESIVSPESVNIGDIIKVLPGEKIPLDGVVTKGSSNLDTSALTGESVPKEVEANDSVISGSINMTGVLLISVTKSYKFSTVNLIVELIEQTKFKKSRSEDFITKFAKYYTPIVVALAALTAFIPPIFVGNLGRWIYIALTFLVISCPCAIVLSVPLSYFCAIGNFAKRGILIKGSKCLETLLSVDSFIFDKTGTITTGKFEIENINAKNDFTAQQVLQFAALAEKNSNHPLAKSISKHYKNDSNEQLIDFEEKSAFGVIARYQDKTIIVGSSKMMKLHNINADNKDGNFVHVAVNGKYAGNIELQDKIKNDSKATIEKLRKQSIKQIVMLTGDNEKTAQSVADNVGINEIRASLLPHEKVAEVENIMKESKVAFVGDGINDAPVIAMADVGIAMGLSGSDSAVEAADIVIMNNKLSSINETLSVSKRTRRIIVQNITFSLAVKFVIMVLGFAGFPSMWAAVFADVGVTIIAVINSIRLLISKK